MPEDFPARLEDRIYLVRSERVMLDADLAELYGVTTMALNQAVRRNINRFPSGFMLILSHSEAVSLISQIVISNVRPGRGGRRKPVLAFTEHGVAMLASVLRSPRAVQVSVAIIRAFIQLRRAVAHYDDLMARIDLLESRYDEQFRDVFAAIRRLLELNDRDAEGEIGFRAE